MNTSIHRLRFNYLATLSLALISVFICFATAALLLEGRVGLSLIMLVAVSGVFSWRASVAAIRQFGHLRQMRNVQTNTAFGTKEYVDPRDAVEQIGGKDQFRDNIWG